MIEFKNKLPRVLSCFFEDFKHLKAYLSAGSIWSNKTKQAIQLGYANRIIYSNILLFDLKKRTRLEEASVAFGGGERGLVVRALHL